MYNELLIIEDTYQVIDYDIRNHVQLISDKFRTRQEGDKLYFFCWHEEDLMLVIRFLVVNGRSFSYSFKG